MLTKSYQSNLALHSAYAYIQPVIVRVEDCLRFQKMQQCIILELKIASELWKKQQCIIHVKQCSPISLKLKLFLTQKNTTQTHLSFLHNHKSGKPKIRDTVIVNPAANPKQKIKRCNSHS